MKAKAVKSFGEMKYQYRNRAFLCKYYYVGIVVKINEKMPTERTIDGEMEKFLIISR